MTSEPTQPAPPAAPPAAAPSRPSAGPAISPGMILTLLGGIAVFVSAFLTWLDSSRSAIGTDVPWDFLWDSKANSENPSFLLWLAIAAVLLALGALIARVRVLGILGGALAIVVAVLYFIQLDSLLNDLGRDEGVFDVAGIGAYVALVGGVVGLIGSLMPRVRPAQAPPAASAAS